MHGRGTYNWAPADRVITEAKRRHLQVMPDIAYTPAWARHNTGRPTDPPSSPIYFGQFMAAMTKRYAPRGIHYWEIWNEPNLSTMWTPRPNATQYVALLKAAYFGIHINDSRATVVTGGLSPAVTTKDRSSIAPYEFATRMYSAGAQGLFTAFGLHPSTYPYPSTYSAAWSTFQHVAPQLYNLMAHHHDGAKKVWATEISFPTGTDPVAVSYANQGPYLVAGVRLWQHRAYGGPIFVYSITDEGTNLASHYANMGLVHYDGTLKPAYTVLRTNILGY
jgi:hypothetical protein